MKVRTSLKKICDKCKIVKRGRKVVVVCEANPRHKQRQGFATLATPAAALAPAPAAAPAWPLGGTPYADLLVGDSEEGEAEVDGT